MFWILRQHVSKTDCGQMIWWSQAPSVKKENAHPNQTFILWETSKPVLQPSMAFSVCIPLLFLYRYFCDVLEHLGGHYSMTSRSGGSLKGWEALQSRHVGSTRDQRAAHQRPRETPTSALPEKKRRCGGSLALH